MSMIIKYNDLDDTQKIPILPFLAADCFIVTDKNVPLRTNYFNRIRFKPNNFAVFQQ